LTLVPPARARARLLALHCSTTTTTTTTTNGVQSKRVGTKRRRRWMVIEWAASHGSSMILPFLTFVVYSPGLFFTTLVAFRRLARQC
jgi:hypothetical protein